jgi:hypothetical protein
MVCMIGRFASNATFTHSHIHTFHTASTANLSTLQGTNIAVCSILVFYISVFYISALSLAHSAPQPGFLEPLSRVFAYISR